MGKLYLGSLEEISQRISNLEDTDVVKVIYDIESVEDAEQSDVIVIAEE
jgi:hypothetical protein